MQHSEKGILTSHAGSLPRPDALIERNRARQSGETSNEDIGWAKLESLAQGAEIATPSLWK